MRHFAVMLTVALIPVAAIAQQRDTLFNRQGLPREVAREATALFNASNTLRTTGPLDVAAGHEVRGDIAVLNGPLTVSGHVTGRVLAINSDVILTANARIDGDLLVVGGDLEGRNQAHVGGDIRIYREPLHFTRQGDEIVAGDTTASDESWWQRLERRRSRNWADFSIASAGAYNRVEGLPIRLGPQLQRVTPWGRVRLDGYGVIRTSGSFDAKENDVGHNVRAEIQLGRREGLGFGGRLFNVVDPVEDWQLSDLEIGLSSFLFHRDYRDYFQRHGAGAFVSGFVRHGLSLTASFGEERWTSRQVHDPFTLFRDDAEWRVNPAVDEGLLHLANLTLKLDTRNDPEHPASGWLMTADWEHGVGVLTPPTVPATSASAAQRHTDYARAFMDLRRYNRLSPDAELNFRLVLGGWLSGDPLPLERRLSVDGPGAMPGYGFRSSSRGEDVATCNASSPLPGMPAMCERITLAQAEYRGNLHVSFGDDDSGAQFREPGAISLRSDGVWVVFVDAGRGWLTNAPTGWPSEYPKNALPPLGTFRSDAGVGLDFGVFGVYLARALSTPGESARFFVRLRHRL